MKGQIIFFHDQFDEPVLVEEIRKPKSNLRFSSVENPSSVLFRGGSRSASSTYELATYLYLTYVGLG